jgi:hypothetical protein
MIIVSVRKLLLLSSEIVEIYADFERWILIRSRFMNPDRASRMRELF